MGPRAANQKALVEAVDASGIPGRQPQVSALMTRLEDLGLVSRSSRKGPYELAQEDAAAAALHHLAALGLALARQEEEESAYLERLACRARIKPLDGAGERAH